ncbi:5656_t:CDS:10 [Funneliformis mosseae]|uniref:5656_t:CDS:1 n=1 Tax=Funneliformis mosseae TaxID=27381 RepID=A0A9N9AME9_FUNMO|nr:5656_t:CDS:10 [Funneliformis mosseae]
MERPKHEEQEYYPRIIDYSFESIFREFLQNADDVGATQFHEPDFESLMQLRVGGKQDDWEAWISGDYIAFLDPQEKFLRQRGIIGHFPTNGIEGLSEKDSLVPFEGIESINFRSNFKGTHFRIPFRREAKVLFEEQDPENSQLQQYAQRFRLRVLDGVARPLENSKARCSDRAMLLIENTDLDQLKLSLNRHICAKTSSQTSKRSHQFKHYVLKYMLQTETILFNDSSEEEVNDHVNNFFECLLRQQSLVRLFPICPIFEFNSEMLLKQLRSDIYCQLPFAGIKQEFQQFIFVDVEFSRESNDSYVRFLNSVLNYYDVVQGLKDKRCFSNSNTRILKNITDLFDPNNSVLLGGNRNTDVFLNSGILEHTESLSSIELQNVPEPPSDILYRGYIGLKFYLENIRKVPIFPVAKVWANLTTNTIITLTTLKNFWLFILSKYRDVAWSKIQTFSFLYNDLRNDDELRNSWVDRFKHDVFEVYKWLEYETSHEGIDLSKYIRLNDSLFLNFTIDQNPFNRDNWVTAKYLILNREPGEDQYVNPMLARYPNMLKGAGVREIKPLIMKYGLSNMINQVLTEKEHWNFY